MLVPCVRVVTLWGQSQIAGKLKKTWDHKMGIALRRAASEDAKMRERERIHKSDLLEG